MGFLHYLRFDDVEIANAARTDAYARTLGLSFFKCDGVCGSLPDVLTDIGWRDRSGYHTPEDDQTWWWDDGEAYEAGFAGMHMLDVQGFTSSTWAAQANESLVDGGFVSRGRYGTREMTFRGLLIGTDLHAVQHGFNWLSTVLHRGNPCKNRPGTVSIHQYRELLQNWVRYKDEASIPADDDVYQAPLVTSDPHTYAGLFSTLDRRNPIDGPDIDDYVARCDSFRMDFFLRCPSMDDYDQLARYYLDVSCTSGPTVLSYHEVQEEGCAAGAWAEVEFTLVAANPFAYRWGIDITEEPATYTYADLLPSGVDKPWWQVYKNEPPLSDDNVYEAPLLTADIPHTYAGLWRLLWRKMPDEYEVPALLSTPTTRGDMVWADPDCPPVPQFPGSPGTDLLCAPMYPGPWNRIVYKACAESLMDFTESALLMEFTAKGQTFHDVRVRLTPEGGDLDTQYDVQFYMHYIPDGATMRIDGRRRSISMYSGTLGATDFVAGPASHLVISDASSASYRFPTLSCGGTYSISIDVPSADDVKKLQVAVEAVPREG